jgi:hypothetical protein
MKPNLVAKKSPQLKYYFTKNLTYPKKNLFFGALKKGGLL